MKKQLLLFLMLPLAMLAFRPAIAQTKAPGAWTIVASYTIPGKASGLAWDGTYIYFGIYGVNGNQVHRFNPANGTTNLQCTGNFEDAFGMSFKGPNLVTVKQPSNSSQPAQIYEFSLSGTEIGTINLPTHYMSGVAYDNGNYWACAYYPDPGTVYKVNASGTVLSQFTPPNTQPWDICVQGSNLWIADYWGDMLYKVTTSGTVLESHASQGSDPAGIVFDGTYLWYCDGPLSNNSTLYKVDLSGAGTPAITIPVTSHNYGNVTVNSTSTWNCLVQNTGNANVVINSVGIPSGQPVSTSLTLPATITPGNSVNLPLTYAPTAAGALNTQVSVNSNDPIHPSIELSLTGQAVYSGPHLTISNPSLDWNNRRAGAYSRLFLPVLNNGDQTLTISGITFSDPHYFIDEAVTFPYSISTMETVNLPVWFHPEEGINYDGTLSIASNDPATPFTVQLFGDGEETLWPMGTVLWSYQINGGFDNSPKSILPIPDITGDSVDDVVVASEDYYLRCFNGNASVSADVLWATAITPSGSVYQQNGMDVIDDIDLDGYADFVAGTTGGDRSINAYSGKTGELIWKHDTHDVGDGGWVYQVDVSFDYNNDQFPDVLASVGDDGNDTGPKRIYCLNGKTGATIWVNPNGGPNFSVIGVEDFTGDGKPDAVAGASNAAETAGRVYGIDGTNGSTKWTAYPAGTSVWALLQIDDFTGDGIKDIASGDFGGNIYFHNAVTGVKEKSKSIGNVLILRFQDMGDVDKNGHPDFIVSHSGTSATMMNGTTDETLWAKPLADKPWTVTNMGDISFDGTNDCGVGTLYQSNFGYFLDGIDGTILEQVSSASAVDALYSIPDIVGDNTKELLMGGREGELVCLSGGYDPTTAIPCPGKKTSTTVKVYPNPCSETATIEVSLPEKSDVTITMTDLLGRQVFTEKITGVSSGIFRHPVKFSGESHLGSGSYLLTVSTDSGKLNAKVIVE